MQPLRRPNIFKDLNHEVNCYLPAKGKHSIVSGKPNRPDGISGRQWDKYKREQRKKARETETANRAAVAAFASMGAK